MCGIYMIKNTVNNKAYIGQAKDIERRWASHRTELNAKRHVNRHLQGAWNKYKQGSFNFVVLEECMESELDYKEQYYIGLYDTYEHGYNLDRGGQGVNGFRHTKEQIDKMRLIQNPLAVLQFDFDFNLINSFTGGVSHASKALGYTRACIERCCKHCGKQISYKDSYWVYEEEYLHPNFSWENYMKQIPCCYVKREKKIKNQRRICQYDKERNLIKVWDSFSDIEDAGYTRNQVNTICNKRKGKKTHKGYIWAYEDYDWADGYFDNLDDAYTGSIAKKKVPVLQVNYNGECINRYDSRTDAGKSIGVDAGCISRAITHRGVCGGYFWANEHDTWFLHDMEYLHSRYDMFISSQKKTTCKLDNTHTIISTYASRSSAADDVGASVGDIARAIANHSMCKGFYWA